MIRPLRRYHFYFWRTAVFVLPVLFILGIALRPNKIESRFSNQDFVIRTIPGDSLTLVEIDLLNPLRNASCIAYAVNGGDSVALGMIDKRGHYTFKCQSNVSSIVLRDEITDSDIVKYSVDLPK